MSYWFLYALTLLFGGLNKVEPFVEEGVLLSLLILSLQDGNLDGNQRSPKTPNGNQEQPWTLDCQVSCLTFE